MDLNERIWSKVNLYHGITDEDCWEWVGSKSKKGYGRLNLFGINKQAHRVVYRLYKGSIESYLFVCHSCDNPSCVNPSHLFLGTAACNNFDMFKKGRHFTGIRPVGAAHVRAKLTDYLVQQIRQSKLTQRETAKRFNISQAVVCNIKNNKAWKHVC